MKVGKAKMGFKDRKDIAAGFYRGHGGGRARNARRRRKAIETRVRQQGKAQCRQGAP